MINKRSEPRINQNNVNRTETNVNRSRVWAFLENAEICKAWEKEWQILGNSKHIESYSQEQVEFLTHQKWDSALLRDFLCKPHGSALDQGLCHAVASLTQKREGHFCAGTNPATAEPRAALKPESFQKLFSSKGSCSKTCLLLYQQHGSSYVIELSLKFRNPNTDWSSHLSFCTSRHLKKMHHSFAKALRQWMNDPRRKRKEAMMSSAHMCLSHQKWQTRFCSFLQSFSYCTYAFNYLHLFFHHAFKYLLPFKLFQLKS